MRLWEEEVAVVRIVESCCMKQPGAIGYVVVLHNHWCLVSLRDKGGPMEIDSNMKYWGLEAKHLEVDIYHPLCC